MWAYNGGVFRIGRGVFPFTELLKVDRLAEPITILNMKKILLVLNTPPPYGGGEIQALSLKQYFSNKERYCILTYSRTSSNKANQGKLNTYNVIFGLLLTIYTIYKIVAIRPKAIYLGLPKEFLPFMKTAIVILFSKAMKIKIYGELAGASFQFLKSPHSLKYKISLPLLQMIDSIRVLGSSIKKHLEFYGIQNTIVIDNGINVPKNVTINKKVQNSNKLKITYVGALNIDKGIGNIIQSLYICKNNGLPIHLDLLGEWSSQKQRRVIEKYIVEHDLKDKVTFHGLITNEVKWSIIRENAILVHPTYWDGQPLAILEAMALGLVIITTPVGAIPDTVKDNVNGIILKENTPEQIYEALKILFSDSDYLSYMSKNNIDTYTRRFTLEKFLKRMEYWFETL